MKLQILRKIFCLFTLLVSLIQFRIEAQIKLGIGAAISPQWCYMTYVRSYANLFDGNDEPYLVSGIGLHADLQLVRWFSLETGLYYTPKGMVLKTPDVKLRINYLNIPIAARFSVPVNKRFSLDYFIGIYYLKLLNHSVKGREINNPKLFQNSTTSFMIGHGFTVQLDPTFSLFSNFRFDLSLSEVEKINTGIPGYNIGQSQHIGYGFYMGIKANISLGKTQPPAPVPKKGRVQAKPKPNSKSPDQDLPNLKIATPRNR